MVTYKIINYYLLPKKYFHMYMLLYTIGHIFIYILLIHPITQFIYYNNNLLCKLHLIINFRSLCLIFLLNCVFYFQLLYFAYP